MNLKNPFLFFPLNLFRMISLDDLKKTSEKKDKEKEYELFKMRKIASFIYLIFKSKKKVSYNKNSFSSYCITTISFASGIIITIIFLINDCLPFLNRVGSKNFP